MARNDSPAFQSMVVTEQTVAFKHHDLISALMNKWFKEMERYRDATGGDVSWWYTERANVGMLASAAVRSDWAALEEYSTDKARPPKKGGKPSSKGRCDLYLMAPKQWDKNEVSFAFETKQVWQPIGTSEPKLERIKKAWDRAVHDAGCLLSKEADHRMAGLFVVPYIQKADYHKAKAELENRLTAIVEFVNSMSDVDLVATHWTLTSPPRDRIVCPGVIFVAGEIKRRRKPKG